MRLVSLRELAFLSICVLPFVLFSPMSAAPQADEDGGLLSSNIDFAGSGRVRLVPDNLFAVDFQDESTGWAGGYYGTILKTEDGGESWRKIEIPYTDLIRRIDFSDELTGFAVTSRGRILKSEDGGMSWAVSHTEARTNLRDIYCLDARTAWVVGHEGTILYTADGGDTWVGQSLTGFQGRDLPRLNGIARFESGRLILVGEFGVVATSTDNGSHWSVLGGAESSVTFTSVATWGNHAMAVGLGGALVKVSELPGSALETGEELSLQVENVNSGTEEHLFDLSLQPSGDGLAVGQGGVLRLVAGAPDSHLAPIESLPGFRWYGGVSAVDKNGNYIVVGSSGALLTVEPDRLVAHQMVRW